jgi:anti-anti-sigma regulatory factor
LEPAYHLIRFEGLLDISRYPEFRSAFEAVPRAVPVLVDLSAVESVDSTFLTEMLLLKRRHDAKLAVLIPSAGHVARVFEIAHIGAKMDVHADLSAAIAALNVGIKPETGEEVGAE